MKMDHGARMRHGGIAILLLLVLLCPATGLALDNDYWNSRLGFQFYPPGARALGMGGAFVGLADDATAAASNPAGIAQLTQMQLAIEGRYMARDSKSSTIPFAPGWEQRSSSSIDDATNISFGAFTTPVFNNLFNISLFYDKPMSFSSNKNATRYVGAIPYSAYPSYTDISVDEAGLSVAKSFCDGKVMFGVGVGAQFLDLKQREKWLQPYAISDPTIGYWAPYYSDSGVDNSDVGVSVRGGGLFKPMDNLRLGISYTLMPEFHTAIKAQSFYVDKDQNYYEGKSRYESTFDIPDNLSFGAAYNIFPNWVVLFEGRYIMYSQLMKGFVITQRQPPVTVRESRPSDYSIDNVMEIHFGTEYVLNAIQNVPIPLRAGFFYEPAHDLKYSGPNYIESRLFDGGDDLMHFTMGAGVVLFNHFQVDVGADITEESRNIALSMVYQF